MSVSASGKRLTGVPKREGLSFSSRLTQYGHSQSPLSTYTDLAWSSGSITWSAPAPLNTFISALTLGHARSVRLCLQCKAFYHILPGTQAPVCIMLSASRDEEAQKHVSAQQDLGSDPAWMRALWLGFHLLQAVIFKDVIRPWKCLGPYGITGDLLWHCLNWQGKCSIHHLHQWHSARKEGVFGWYLRERKKFYPLPDLSIGCGHRLCWQKAAFTGTTGHAAQA